MYIENLQILYHFTAIHNIQNRIHTSSSTYVHCTYMVHMWKVNVSYAIRTMYIHHVIIFSQCNFDKYIRFSI